MHTNSQREPLSVDRTNPLYCLNANLRKAARMILTVYMDDIRDSGLQGTQFTLLTTISAFGQVKIGDLAQFLGMDQTTVTRNVNVLRKSGYANVIQGDDRRTRLVELTQTGKTAVESTYPKWMEAQTKFWDQLGDEKAMQLLEITQRVTEIASGKQ